jgi:hypothetical protein
MQDPSLDSLGLDIGRKRALTRNTDPADQAGVETLVTTVTLVECRPKKRSL